MKKSGTAFHLSANHRSTQNRGISFSAFRVPPSAFKSPSPGAFVGALHFAPALVDKACLSLAQLARELVTDAIDRHVQVVGGFLRKNIRTGNRQVNFGAKALLRVARVVVHEDNVRSDDVGEVLEFRDHGCGMLMQCSGEPKMSRA